MEDKEILRLLVTGLNSLGLPRETIHGVVSILETPDNESRMVDWLINLGREPTEEEVLRMAEFIRKY